jgi:murein DD-endopeptidase MepM/ murein hydrolase activator NlpD
VASTVAVQLPGPVRDAAFAWIQGTPQAVGHYYESDFPPGYVGQVIEGGNYYWEPMYYTGPESFVCQLPVRVGKRTSRYGDDRGNGYSHTGVDYGSHQRSEEIYAPMGGMVTHAGWSYWLGWTVVVENDGNQVILGHMCCGSSGTTGAPTGESTIEVSPGDVIDAGDVVGQTGDTGNSDGIHLHFEVRQCDEGGRCQIQDPSGVILPGQDSFCRWEDLGADD